jgi:thiol-disulfide isomerase/thioredoxin
MSSTRINNAANSKASRKSDKKATKLDNTAVLRKAFAGAIAAILLPAALLVFRHILFKKQGVEAELREPAVLPLSGSVFDLFLQLNPDGALIEFYMPDCDHCKKLAPEIEAAAKEMAALGGPPFASLNGEEFSEVAKRYGVFRYPTVFWFREGQALQELRPTSRTKEKIVEFVNWVQQPSFTEFETMAEFDEAVPTLRLALQETSPPVVVGFAVKTNATSGDETQKALSHVGERLRGKVLFLYIKEEVADADNMAPLRSYAASPDSDSFFSGPISSFDSVQTWVESLLPNKKKELQ